MIDKILGTWVPAKLIEDLRRLLPPKPRYLDLGCGDGGLTSRVMLMLNSQVVYGVDMDEDALKRASQRGIIIYSCDLSRDKLPFNNNYFDLVTAFDVIEHLLNPDHMLKESYRVLKRNGVLVIETPNLASWISRVYLLFGYQPPDVDVSMEIKAGACWLHKGKPAGTLGHIRAFTLRALEELLKFHGFKFHKCIGMYHTIHKLPPPLNWLDKIIARLNPSLSHHLIVIAVKDVAIARAQA